MSCPADLHDPGGKLNEVRGGRGRERRQKAGRRVWGALRNGIFLLSRARAVGCAGTFPAGQRRRVTNSKLSEVRVDVAPCCSVGSCKSDPSSGPANARLSSGFLSSGRTQENNDQVPSQLEGPASSILGIVTRSNPPTSSRHSRNLDKIHCCGVYSIYAARRLPQVVYPVACRLSPEVISPIPSSPPVFRKPGEAEIQIKYK